MNKEKTANLFLSAALFLVSFLVYLKTLAPTVTFGDSGELITAINTLGVPHPTGFPLYILLGKLFSMLPAANPAFRINLMSAVFASCVPVLVFQAMLLFSRKSSSAAKGFLLSFFSAALIIFSYTLWSQSGMARIYSLNALFCAATLLVFFLYNSGSRRELLYFFAFLTGLGSGLHLTFAVTAAILWIFIASGDPKTFFKNLFIIAVFFLIGLSAYLYIIIRGGSDITLQWTKFTSPDDVFGYFSQRQYKGKMLSRDAAGFASYFGYIGTVIWRELSPLGLLLMIAGAITGLVRRFRYALALILIFAVNILILAMYGNYTDLKLAFRYLIPSYIAGLFLIYMFFEFITSKAKKWQTTAVITALIFVITAGISLPVNLRENNKSNDFLAYFYAKDMIASLPEKASFFSSGDNQIYPLAYSKYVLKSAPGVTVFDVIPTIFKDIKTLYADSSPASVAYNIMKAFSLNLQPVFSSSPTGAKIYNEKPSGLIYAQSNKPLQPSFYMWQVYGLKGILNDTQYYHDFEEREVVGTYLYRFGGYYNSLGRKDIYSYLLDRGAEEAYDSLPVLANIAVLYTSDTTLDKNYAKAELLFKKAEALNPDNTDVLFNFGSFYGTIGLPDKAAKYFERIMKKEPLNFNAKMYYAKAVAQVQAEYDRQVKLGKDQIVHYEAGTQFFNNKKFDEALKEFTLDTRNNPNLPRSYFYIGLIYSMEKNYENAIPMYEKALQFDPNNVGALNNIGLCHMNLKQYKKAAEYFSLSLKIKPGQDRIKKVMEGLGNKI